MECAGGEREGEELKFNSQRTNASQNGADPPFPESEMNIASDAITDDDAEPPYQGDMIIVASRLNTLDGELLRGRLLAEDIPATLADNYLVNANALWTPAIGGVRIRVPASFEIRALRVIADIESGALALPDDDDSSESVAQATAFAASRRRALRWCLAAFVGVIVISELLNAVTH
jgi:hypothetical protein